MSNFVRYGLQVVVTGFCVLAGTWGLAGAPLPTKIISWIVLAGLTIVGNVVINRIGR